MTGRRERQESGGFAVRLREVIDAYGSASAVADAIERSEGAVRKWLRGESEPNVTDLRSVCELTATRIEWLVSGTGERQAPAERVDETQAPPYRNPVPVPLSASLLEAVLLATQEELQERGLQLPPTKLSVLVVTLYELSRERGTVDREALARLVRLAG